MFYPWMSNIDVQYDYPWVSNVNVFTFYLWISNVDIMTSSANGGTSGHRPKPQRLRNLAIPFWKLSGCWIYNPSGQSRGNPNHPNQNKTVPNISWMSNDDVYGQVSLKVQCRCLLTYLSNVEVYSRSGRLSWVMVPKWHVAWHHVEKTKLFGVWGQVYGQECNNFCIQKLVPVRPRLSSTSSMTTSKSWDLTPDLSTRSVTRTRCLSSKEPGYCSGLMWESGFNLERISKRKNKNNLVPDQDGQRKPKFAKRVDVQLASYA